MASLGKTQGYMAKVGLDLSDIDKQIKTLQTELKQVDKALANDADNAVLLNQRYAILNETIEKLSEKLTKLSDASDKVNQAVANKQIQDADLRNYQRIVEETKISIEQLTAEEQKNNTATEQAGEAAKEAADDIETISPAATSAGESIMSAKAGETLKLDASATTDPDGDALNFHWWQQPEIGAAKVSIEGDEKPVATIHIPADAAGSSIHLICEVHDEGPFHLVAYRRIILSIR